MDFLVRRDDLHECRTVEAPDADLERGQARLEIDAFGLTSNNITYAVLGDALSYWSFFPAEEGWGRVPVWGFADVVESAHDGIEEGTRVYGYLPPSRRLVVNADRTGARGFVDASPHRASLPSTYNWYARVDADPGYAADYEDQQMLLRPLFFTSFLIADFLDDEKLFGAGSVVLSSASSKTALGTAFLLAQRGDVEVIGLTSPGNAGFVQGLGIYDRVIPYAEIASLPTEGSVYVDLAGDAELRAAVHGHLGDALAHSAVVGVTHWDRADAGDGEPLPGPAPTFFFAPARVEKRAADWGGEVLQDRLAQAWIPLVKWTTSWLEVEHGRGPEAVESVYRKLLDGRGDPSRGQVLSLSERGEETHGEH